MFIDLPLCRLGHYEKAASLLTEMGELALKNWLRRHLGRALHLLGELHLRREKPELGTEHLAEAFHCFLGNFINVSRLILFETSLHVKETLDEILVIEISNRYCIVSKPCL